MALNSRIDPSEHARLPWLINQIASDFKLIDAWALPAEGDLKEFTDLCSMVADLDLADDKSSKLATALFAVRRWLGQRFGWDDAPNTLAIPGCTETSLQERLPDDPAIPGGETISSTSFTPFRSVYRTQDEWALELSNTTVHAVIHLGWVSHGGNRYRGQLGIYVKPRGRSGAVYMAAIAPFRHLIIYPALMRRIERTWQARTG